MTIAELKIQLESVNHSREKRKTNSTMVIQNPELIPMLFTIAQEVNKPISCRAMWLLEFVCREDLQQILPYLNEMLQTIKLVKLDPAIRPAAKICEYLIVNYYSKNPIPKIHNTLTQHHKEFIAECCFDWMIDDTMKVAPKAYSMTSLYLLGNELNWIHEELSLILEQQYHTGSAAYKARARMVLEKIKKNSAYKTLSSK